MTAETVFTNARIVTRDDVFTGSVAVADGRIRDMGPGPSALSSAIDLEGELLIPGLIDIHTDNLERHLEPRPGVRWPAMAALLIHDRQVASAGITTVFDALCVGHFEGTSTGRQDALILGLEAMERLQADGLLRAEHFIHLRCEMSAEDVVEAFRHLVQDPCVRLVSVMDHTPGQRQWSDLDKWRQYYSRRNFSEQELLDIIAHRRDVQERCAAESRRAVITLSRERGLPLASHDDTTPEHVIEAVKEGITISEFPTTEEAARTARTLGIQTVMGSPNVVNGGSHSGNASVRDLADKGLLNGLASDYVPVSMIHAAFILHEESGLALPDAVATVTANPARMVGLDDRGEIAPGQRADLVWVKVYETMPVVRGVWRAGERVI